MATSKSTVDETKSFIEWVRKGTTKMQEKEFIADDCKSIDRQFIFVKSFNCLGICKYKILYLMLCYTSPIFDKLLMAKLFGK